MLTNKNNLKLSIILILLCGFLISCSTSHSKEKRNAVKAVPVAVANAVIQDMSREIELIGRIEPCSYVDVKSKVDGILDEIHFKDGEFVKKGQVLFTIDPAPYKEHFMQDQAMVKKSQAGIEQSKANYAKSIALEKEASANLEKAIAQKKELQANIQKNEFLAKNAFDSEKRYAELLKNGYTTQEQYNNIKTNADVLRAQLDADRESIANASLAIEAAMASKETASAATRSQKTMIDDASAQFEASVAEKNISSINLSDCTIISPIDGRAGSLKLFKGNLIRTGNNQTLITINQLKPIYATCSLPEKYLKEIRELSSKHSLVIKVRPKDSGKVIDTGIITFIDNQVDINTGTIQIRGLFKNPNCELWPGQFVTASIALSKIKDAVVVPSQAIQTGQNGDFAFVVKGETAQFRNVETGPSLDGKTVVTKGISAGETVVTEGQLRLAEGMKVEIVERQKPGLKSEKET